LTDGPDGDAANGHMARRPEPEVMDDAEEARAYAEADFAEVNRAFVERLTELAGQHNVPADARALDLGTGPGDIPLLVASALSPWHITAVDASQAMIGIALEKVFAGPDRRTPLGNAHVKFIVADAKATGLPAHSFDVVFSNSILHHITETDLFWAEVQRLAKPGAVAFLRDLARPPSRKAAQEIVDRYAPGEPPKLREEYYRSLLSAHTPDEIRRQLDRAGLGALQVAMASDRHVDVFGRLP